MFKFKDYINKHLNAHKELLEIGYNNGNGVDEATKIYYFKSNILILIGQYRDHK